MSYNPETGNLLFLQLALGFIVGRLVVVFLLLPHYFRGQLYTAYEVLDRRFGGLTKQTASLLFVVTRNLADGLRLYLTAIVLEPLLGLDLVWCIVIIGLITILYTFFGGMRSVVWNDCIQFLVYMAGAVLAGWVILSRLPGGWEQFVEYGMRHDKFRLWDFSLDLSRTYTFWSGLVGGAFVTLATHGTDQMMVQRYLAAGSWGRAGRALALSGLVILAQFALFLLLGVGLASFYDAFPPQVAFTKPDEVFASFIVRQLPVGLVGITLAAVFSAAMSTLSSSLNSSATAAVNDFYLPATGRDASAQHVLAVSRILTVGFGLVQIGVAIAGSAMTRSVIDSVLAIASFTSGSILGVFFLGVLTKRVSQQAALIGLVTGLSVLTAVAFGPRLAALLPLPEPWSALGHWQLAWPWFAVVGSMTTLGAGWLAGIWKPARVQTG